MLASDWRADARPFVVVDFAQWPADLPIDPLPCIPVLGVGPRDHPQAQRADAFAEPPIGLARLTAHIAAKPRAASAIVQLLRATAGAPPEHALIAESFAYATLQASQEHAAWRSNTGAALPASPGLLHTHRSGDRLELVIDRPHAHNAIDRTLRDALFDAFTLAALDESISRILLTATGRVFSAGADLGEFGLTHDPAEAHAIRARTLPAWPMLRRARDCEVHIQGACIGAGLELAAFAGRVTASPSAWFQLPELVMGVLPGFGGCVSLPRRIGRQRAALLMLSGKRISAPTALKWGLIDALVD